ncbi:uncharacterized protein LOC126712410 [Quercus robur]|uniref:uncharacterized protein LOC126712410 n=1 Tax=Quercus robur TaxID=38942 RepID=UPI002161B3C5|nr:uncharacterized protein LOC126712410 [Quercus robur]
MNELVAAEGILGIASVDTNMVEASSSEPKSKGKGGKKKDFTKQDGKQLALGVANKGKKKVKDYTQGKCFHCGEKGHWERNCLKFIAGKNKGFQETRRQNEEELFLTLAYGSKILVVAKSEAFEKFKEFRAKVENQLGKRIKAIRSDRGGKYLLGDFKDYLTENGIITQLTALGTTQKMV